MRDSSWSNYNKLHRISFNDKSQIPSPQLPCYKPIVRLVRLPENRWRALVDQTRPAPKETDVRQLTERCERILALIRESRSCVENTQASFPSRSPSSQSTSNDNDSGVVTLSNFPHSKRRRKIARLEQTPSGSSTPPRKLSLSVPPNSTISPNTYRKRPSVLIDSIVTESLSTCRAEDTQATAANAIPETSSSVGGAVFPPAPVFTVESLSALRARQQVAQCGSRQALCPEQYAALAPLESTAATAGASPPNPNPLPPRRRTPAWSSSPTWTCAASSASSSRTAHRTRLMRFRLRFSFRAARPLLRWPVRASSCRRLRRRQCPSCRRHRQCCVRLWCSSRRWSVSERSMFGAVCLLCSLLSFAFSIVLVCVLYSVDYTVLLAGASIWLIEAALEMTTGRADIWPRPSFKFQARRPENAEIGRLILIRYAY